MKYKAPFLSIAASSCLFFVPGGQAEQVVEAWVKIHEKPGGYDDRAYAVVVDSSDNVYVTGYSRFPNYQSFEMATVAYSSAGAVLWTNYYYGSGGGAAGAAIALGKSNVYVAGFSVQNSYTNSDYLTIAFSSSGVPLWTSRYIGPANGNDYVTAAAVDKNDNVIVTGHSVGVGTSDDFTTIACSSAGLPLWTNRYNGPGNKIDRAYGIAVDSNNSIYVTGYSYSGEDGTTADFATISYSSTGLPLWTNRYNGPGNGDDRAFGLAIDRSNTVYVTGYESTSNTLADYATIAYSSAGLPLWTNRYNGLANNDDQAKAVAVDSNNNVYVTGYSRGAGADYATIAYSSTGVPLWTNRYDGPSNSDDQATAVAVDRNNNVVVTGQSRGNGSYEDYATIAYSSVGVPLWTNRYNGPANRNDIQPGQQSLAIASDGVVVTGASNSDLLGGLVCDYVTIKYTYGGLLSPIPLSIQRTGNLVILSWTNPAFALQTTPSISSIFTNIPGAASPHTNLITGSAQWFRLISN